MAEQFNPFPGLRPFRMEEKYLFFGREAQTAELLQRLRENRFLAVVGTSGSGKSSLVQAGLLPELHGGTMVQAGSHWEVALLRPGGAPLTHLAQALIDADLYDPEQEDILDQVRATLSRSGLGLAEAARQSDMDPESNLLVVVDQFEEIFRFRRSGAANEEEASAFVNLLLEATQQESPSVFVALTMRSDYLGDCSDFPGLAEAVNDGEYLIPRLSREQRRSAIVGPVKVGGGEMAPRLLQKLLNDVGDDPDHLPVLQHALMRTWDHWVTHREEGEPMDLRHYADVGGIHEALSRHADEVFEELESADQRHLCERLFKALTERGADSRGIRRPTRLSRLGEIADTTEDEVTQVVEAFRKAGRTFLMPPPEKALAPDTVVDISHESLMRVWKRLDRWVEEESQSARVYLRLADTAELHAEKRAGLYHDPDLQIACSWRDEATPNQAWAEQYGGDFQEAMEFLRASEEAAREKEREREAERQRQLEQAQRLAETQERAARGFRRFAVWMGAVALLAVAALFMAVKARRAADENALEAAKQATLAEEAKREAQESASALQETLVRSSFRHANEDFEAGKAQDGLAYLAEALRVDPSFWQAGMRAVSALSQRGFVAERVRSLSMDSPFVEWIPRADVGLALTLDQEGQTVIWDLLEAKRVSALNGGEPLLRPQFAPNGESVYAVIRSAPNQLRGWNAQSGEPVGQVMETGPIHDFELVDHPEKGLLALIVQEDGRVILVETASGEALASPLAGRAPYEASVFHPNRELAYVLFRDGILATVRLSDGQIIGAVRAGFNRGRLEMNHQAEDDYFLIAQNGNRTEIDWWRLDAERLPVSEEDVSPVQFDKPVTDLLYLDNDQKITCVSPIFQGLANRNWQAITYDLATREEVSVVELTTVTRHFGPWDEERRLSLPIVATGISGNRVGVWNLRTGNRLGQTFRFNSGISRTAFTPDGRAFVTALNSGEFRMWNSLTGAPLFDTVERNSRFYDAFFSPDGRILYLGERADDALRGWDTETGRQVMEAQAADLVSLGQYHQVALGGGALRLSRRNRPG